MKLIPLNRGFVTRVSDEDYDHLSRYKWSASVRKLRNGEETVYAITSGLSSTGKRTIIYMHRLIMGNPPCEVDHKDRDSLNNERTNLRNANERGNGANRYRKTKHATSRFLGVSTSKRDAGAPRPWTVQIKINKKNTYIGAYRTEEEAARVYDREARKHHGEFAALNFPEEPMPDA